jgi:hypothetical protein
MAGAGINRSISQEEEKIGLMNALGRTEDGYRAKDQSGSPNEAMPRRGNQG